MEYTACTGDPDTSLQLCAWEAAKRDRDYPRADALRASLRAAGVNPDTRTPTNKLRYDDAWAARTRGLRFISTDCFLASALGWALSPKLQRCRHPDDGGAPDSSNARPRRQRNAWIPIPVFLESHTAVS